MTSRDLLVIINYKFWKGDFMAIFYKHIKGCGSNTTSNDSGCWSWIEWSNSTTSTPKIYTNSKNNATGWTSLGNIITSNATDQAINNSFTFKNNVVVEDILYFYNNSGTSMHDTGSKFELILRDGAKMEAYSGGIYFSTKVYLHKDVSATEKVKLQNGLYVGDKIETYPAKNGVIKADDKCEALYFNATSDRRAKSNITPLSASALSIVKSLPVYTFNYTSKPEETTIGLIAQEAAEYDLDNFNMVDNLTATGENNDFMQMKESKLVYVLWKAVQELSAEVESLKQQLASK